MRRAAIANWKKEPTGKHLAYLWSNGRKFFESPYEELAAVVTQYTDAMATAAARLLIPYGQVQNWVVYNSDPVVPPKSSPTLTVTCPGGLACINGVRVDFNAFSVTMPASKIRRYYLNSAGDISYDEEDVLNYSVITRRQPDSLVYIYQLTSSATTVDSILPMTNTFEVDTHDNHIVGSIDHFVELFYIYDVTTSWSAGLTVTYGQILQTSTGACYQVTTPGVTGSVAPTGTSGYITDGNAVVVYYGMDYYLSAFRYAQNNGIEWYFDNIGLEEIIHLSLRSGSPLGPGAGTTMASLVKKHIKTAFKHLCADFYSGGTYLRGMKLITDGWIWICTSAGTVAATNADFVAAAPHSLGQTVTSGSSDWKAIYQSFGSQTWFWLNVDETFLVYRYPDSHDSYCSSFFSLVARYVQVTNDWTWLNDASPQPSMATYKDILDVLLYTNLDTQLSNFLSKSFQGDIAPWDGSSFTTQYFEDNCETVKGYTDAAALYAVLGDTTRAASSAVSSAYVEQGVYALFNATYNLCAWYYGNDVSTWVGRTDLQFYPYVQAQFYAEKCNLPTFTEDMHYAIRQAVFTLYPNWITDRGKDSFPNNFIGLLAARDWKDPVLAQSFVDQSERYHLDRGALIISEYACYLRIKECLVQNNFVLKASNTEVLFQDSQRNVTRFYNQGTWTPSFTGLTVVLGGGTVTYAGRYTNFGKMTLFEVTITPAGGATTASSVGATYCDMPNTPAQDGICMAVDKTTHAGIQLAHVDASTSRIYTPTWVAGTDTIVIMGIYER